MLPDSERSGWFIPENAGYQRAKELEIMKMRQKVKISIRSSSNPVRISRRLWS